MASSPEFIAYVREQADLGARLSSRKMFGEYALYLDGKVVGFACDDSLFLKSTPAAPRLVPGAPQRPPYPGAKLYPVIDEWLDDGEMLRDLLQATADELPEPAPKRKRPTRQPSLSASSANTASHTRKARAR